VHQRKTQDGRSPNRLRGLSVEDKLIIKQEVQQDDRFIRSAVQSNRLKLIIKEKDGRAPSDLQRWGFDNTSMGDKKFFDPLRLKILVMPCQEANPVGRNADYFFLKGFKEASTEDYAHAMAAYLKGLDIKSDHLLCRFNLGVALFSLGLYDEACSQYDILVK
jgi:tetratricopeptide (TPR) repeat protein